MEGVFKQIKKIRWPSKKEVVKTTRDVLIVLVFFVGFFLACTTVLNLLMSMN